MLDYTAVGIEFNSRVVSNYFREKKSIGTATAEIEQLAM